MQTARHIFSHINGSLTNRSLTIKIIRLLNKGTDPSPVYKETISGHRLLTVDPQTCWSVNLSLEQLDLLFWLHQPQYKHYLANILWTMHSLPYVPKGGWTLTLQLATSHFQAACRQLLSCRLASFCGVCIGGSCHYHNRSLLWWEIPVMDNF